MQYRLLGRTGWQVSKIGFGGWQIGGSCGAVNDEESIRTLHYAWDKGIHLFDTAQLYGSGRSEAVMGEALKHQVSVLIPGMSTPQEVDRNIGVADGGVFPAELLAKRDSHAWVAGHLARRHEGR